MEEPLEHLFSKDDLIRSCNKGGVPQEAEAEMETNIGMFIRSALEPTTSHDTRSRQCHC